MGHSAPNRLFPAAGQLAPFPYLCSKSGRRHRHPLCNKRESHLLEGLFQWVCAVGGLGYQPPIRSSGGSSNRGPRRPLIGRPFSWYSVGSRWGVYLLLNGMPGVNSARRTLLSSIRSRRLPRKARTLPITNSGNMAGSSKIDHLLLCSARVATEVRGVRQPLRSARSLGSKARSVRLRGRARIPWDGPRQSCSL